MSVNCRLILCVVLVDLIWNFAYSLLSALLMRLVLPTNRYRLNPISSMFIRFPVIKSNLASF